MSKKVVGRCSLCGGDVVMPTIWHGVYPPEPSCTRCGAIAKKRELPVIDMEQPDYVKMHGRWWSWRK